MKVELHFDTSQLEADIALLSEVAGRSTQLRQRLLDCGDLCAHLVCIDADLASASTAGQVRIRLQFSDAFAELVRAVRAGKFDGFIV